MLTMPAFCPYSYKDASTTHLRLFFFLNIYLVFYEDRGFCDVNSNSNDGHVMNFVK
jgi:hypothetical protein